MTKSLSILLMILLNNLPLFTQVDTAWVRRYGLPDVVMNDAYAIVTDKSGNVYVGGFSEGFYVVIKYYPNGDTAWTRNRESGVVTPEIGAHTLAVDKLGNVYTAGTTSGDLALVTVKYSPDGNIAWENVYQEPTYSSYEGNAITVDDAGNVYVTGGGIENWPNQDIITIKYFPNGDTAWVRRYQGAGAGQDITVDKFGDIVMTGGNGFVTIKYLSGGDTAWVRTYNGPASSSDMSYAMTLDRMGNIYVTGWSDGVGTGLDYATIKYLPNGDVGWINRYDGPGNSDDWVDDITADDSGNVYVTGSSARSSITPQSFDYATIKYYSNGDTAWVRRYNGSGDDWDGAHSIAVNNSGSVYVTGFSASDLTPDDYLTIKYFPNGDIAWIQRYDGPANSMDLAFALAIDDSGFIYVTGGSDPGSEVLSDITTIKYVDASTDVGIVSILSPTGNAKFDSVITPEAIIRNNGRFEEVFNVVLEIGTEYEDVVNVMLSPWESDTISFTPWHANKRGAFSVECSTQLTSDQYGGNNLKKRDVIVGLEIYSITPNYGGDVGSVSVEIFGLGYQQGAKVKLTKLGQQDIVADTALTTVIDSTQIVALFDLRDKQLGAWNVDVTSPTGDSAVFYGGFTIEVGYERLWVDIVGREQIRVGGEERLRIRCINQGNVDLEDLLLEIAIPNGFMLKRVRLLNEETIWDRDTLARDISEGKLTNPADWIGISDSMLQEHYEKSPIVWCSRIVCGATSEFDIVLIALPSVFGAGRWNPQSQIKNQEDATALPVILVFVKVLAVDAMKKWGQHFVSQLAYYNLEPDASLLGAMGKAFKEANRLAIPEIAHDLDPRNIWKWSKDAVVEWMKLAIGTEGAGFGFQTKLAGLLNRYGCNINKARQVGWDIKDALERRGVTSTMLSRFSLYSFAVTTTLKIYEKTKRAGDEWGAFAVEGEKRVIRVQAIDPNEKVGPSGVSFDGYIPLNASCRYAVYFENVDSATAAAQEVEIKDTLDANLDFLRFSFGEIRIGVSLMSLVNIGQSLNLSYHLNDTVDVDVTGSFNPSTGIIRWYMKGRDRRTGELANFLPPNDSLVTPKGEGWVSFGIEPESILVTGTRITNRASIIFDVNSPILTNEVHNTIDDSPPHSYIVPFLTGTASDSLIVSWTGIDSGSGIATYRIYVADSIGNTGTAFNLWKTTSDTFAVFDSVKSGRTYYFYSKVIDRVGNQEIKSDTVEAKISIVTEVSEINNLPKQFALFQNYPNPFNPRTVTKYTLPVSCRVWLKIFNVLGQEVKTLVDEIQEAGYKSVEWNATELASGVYFYRLEATSTAEPTKSFTQVKKSLLLK